MLDTVVLTIETQHPEAGVVVVVRRASAAAVFAETGVLAWWWLPCPFRNECLPVPGSIVMAMCLPFVSHDVMTS